MIARPTEISPKASKRVRHVALGVLMNKDNTVKQAGGFIIQLLPGASDEMIDQLEKKLGEITSITSLLDEGKTPEMILNYILGEFGLEIIKRCDSVILVTANIETRYARIMKRDGLSRREARARIAAQMPQWKKKRYADYIIENDMPSSRWMCPRRRISCASTAWLYMPRRRIV